MGLSEKLKVLLVSSEVEPFAKSGGLADVIGSLPIALTNLGVDVRVVMPKYKMINLKHNYIMDFPMTVGSRKEAAIIRESSIDYDFQGEIRSIPVYFVDNYHYFDRDGLYGYYDDAERFVFFCKSVINMLPYVEFKPDIIHCNDWQTGSIPMMLTETYKKYPFYNKMKTIFTIHNLKYQGVFNKEVFCFFDVSWDAFTTDKTEFYGSVSLIKSAIYYADIITTVSKTYANEIQTYQYGENLDGFLRIKSDKLHGIVNGIDCDVYNPLTDSKISTNYDQSNYYYLKKENKFVLQNQLGLLVKDVPVISIISRLTDQKGLNLILEAIDSILALDVQLIILGAGDYYYEEELRKFREKYPKKYSLNLEYNINLSHKIYAGSDMFLMPSLFEPCGLGQLISLRYGTVPIVRAIGGLADTVIDIEEDQTQGNGFTFKEFSSIAMLEAIRRAITIYCQDHERWNHIMWNGITNDCSWNKSAKQYLDLYNSIREE